MLLDDVRTVLAGLSGDFDRNAVCAALGYQPERSSLYRILQGLVMAGELSLRAWLGQGADALQEALEAFPSLPGRFTQHGETIPHHSLRGSIFRSRGFCIAVRRANGVTRELYVAIRGSNDATHGFCVAIHGRMM